MIPFILSILASSLIFVIFKLFKKYNIDTFQAIVVNYFTAALIGFIFYGNTWKPEAMEQNGWMLYAVIASLLFIFIFFILGRSSQENGVASTSIAVKMSMAISLVLLIVYHSESPSLLKIGGIVLAFIGVLLVSVPEKKAGEKSKYLWMLLILFFGCGGLDFLLNYVQDHELTILQPSLFSAISLGLSGVIGLVILTAKMAKGTTKIEGKNIIAGLILGVPNFFSIYLLLLSYKSTGWEGSTVLALTNVSVVLLSSFFGFLFFREATTSKKIIGLITAVLAIATLYIAEQNF
ncbi:MAG: EamA family transporter [Fluviicola sp.]|nr:EamA family transporter [Fluviicola sp.]